MARLQPTLEAAAGAAVGSDDPHAEADEIGPRRRRLGEDELRGRLGEPVVAVEEEDVVGLRREDPGASGLERREVASLSDEPDPRVPRPVGLDDLGRPVGGRVVDADDLDLGEGLCQAAVEGRPDAVLVVVDGDDDGDAGR